MNRKDYDGHPDSPTQNISDEDSEIYADEETARLELAGIFSNRLSNILPFYKSETGVAELHTCTRYGKRFVLKGLRREFRDDPVYNMCMAKEFEIGITLDHPNIRRTVGLEDVAGLGKRIVLEYVDGRTLADALSCGKLPQERARAIAIQIADVLKYLHSKQICHRDLKPENILLPYQGESIKVIDFNLSDSGDYIVLKNPAGSKRYMAPELWASEAEHTPETDYYSLGVIMKDLAEASGDRLLSQAAVRCMDPDPQKRQEGLTILATGKYPQSGTSLPLRMLSSRTLTYILSAICLILAAVITIHYWQEALTGNVSIHH